MFQRLAYHQCSGPIWLDPRGRCTAQLDERIQSRAALTEPAGNFSGDKYRRGFAQHTVAELDKTHASTHDMLEELYELEVAYSGELYERRPT